DALGGHGADDHALDALLGPAAAAVEPLAADLLGDLGEVGRGEHFLDRQHAEQRHAESGQTFAGELADEVHLVGLDLVENGAGDLDAGLVEEGFVERDFVDGAADAAGGDERDLGVEQAGDAGVAEVEHAADAGVAGAPDDG